MSLIMLVLGAVCVPYAVVAVHRAINDFRGTEGLEAARKDAASGDINRQQANSSTLVRALVVALGITIVVPVGLYAQQALTSHLQTSQQTDSSSRVETSLLSPLDSISQRFSSSEADSTNANPDDLTGTSVPAGNSVQPPPRRTYSRPTYSDNSHNADGSNKYTFLVGGGFTLPTGNTRNDLKTNFNLQGGVGRNFNNNVGLIAQFDFANFGIQNTTLNTLLATYNGIGAVDQNGNPISQLGGSSHVWSLTINPIYYVSQSDSSGIYVVGGFGFYHKTANFTIPAVGTYCDPYYGCYQYQANQSIDKYTSNAFGVNAGIGFTHKLSHFASQRLFVEARYVFVDNQPRPYSLGSTTNSYFNVFPQNSEETTFIPVTVGIRF